MLDVRLTAASRAINHRAASRLRSGGYPLDVRLTAASRATDPPGSLPSALR